MKNYLQLELGGKLRGLKFNINTLRFIGEITGKDPFEFAMRSRSFSDTLDFVETLTHAALLSNCASKKEEPEFSGADVKEWLGELSPSIIGQIVSVFTGQTQGDSGEVGADTQENNVG